MIWWCKLVRENMPVKYIFNVNQFTAYVCLFPRSTLPCADSPYPMLVLTGPQGCGKRELTHRLCQDLSEFFAYGSVTNICILKLTYVTGTPQLEIKKPYLCMFASTESVTPQGGPTMVRRMVLITISSTRESFRIWFTRCVSFPFSSFDLRSKWKKSCAQTKQVDILAFDLKCWISFLPIRHPPFHLHWYRVTVGLGISLQFSERSSWTTNVLPYPGVWENNEINISNNQLNSKAMFRLM